MIAAWLDAIQDKLLPPICLPCGASGTDGRDLCAGCAVDLPRNALACPGCATPLATGQTGFCQNCRSQPFPFDSAFVPFRYQPPIDFLVRGLKFDGRLSHGRLLGELFADALAERGDPLPDRIVPVPLHPRRLRERGFNQALELARPVAKKLQRPLSASLCQRIRNTPAQADLPWKERRKNIRHAFQCTADVTGQTILLVDDVMTTGSSLDECARTLKLHGAKAVIALVVARVLQK